MKKQKFFIICIVLFTILSIITALGLVIVSVALIDLLNGYKKIYIGSIKYDTIIPKYTFYVVATIIGAIFCLIVSGVLIYLLIKMLFSDKLKAARNQKVEARAERKRQALEKKKEAIDKKLSAVEKKEEKP